MPAPPSTSFDPSLPYEVATTPASGVGGAFDPGQPYEVHDGAAPASQSDAPPSDSSFGADLQAGLHGALDSAGAAFQGVGGIMARNGVPGGGYVSGAGDWLRGNAPAVPQDYHGRGGDIVSDLSAGNYGRAAGDVVHGIVQGAPLAAGAIGAGAALDAVGLPVAAGAALVGGVTGLGAGAASRAAAAGRDTPDTSDVVGALPRAAADALASGVTFGRMPLGVAGRVAAGAAAGAGQSAVDQVDATGTVDPAQVANAAITTGATVGAAELPGMAAWGAKAASDRAIAATLDKPASTDDATSVLRVKADMDAIRDTAVQSNGSAPPATAIANSVKAEYAARLNTISNGWFRSGLIDRDALTDLRTLVNNQALRHNNTIADGSDELPTLFSQVDALDNVPDAARQTFKDGVRDLNTVSSQSFIKNTVGPVQRLSQLAGTWGPAAAALASGNPIGAAAAALGHGVTGKVAGAVGAKVDQALGLNTPPVVLQAINASRALRKAGIDPSTVSGSLPALAAAASRRGVDPVTGLPRDPVPVNTPIPANAARSSVGLPALRIDTPADVAATVAQDDGQSAASAGSPIDPVAAARLRVSLGRLQGGAGTAVDALTPGSATTPPAAPQVPPADSTGTAQGTFTPGSRYIANVVPGLDHAGVVEAARAAEAAGRVPAGTADMIDTSPAPIDPAIGRALQQHALEQVGLVYDNGMGGTSSRWAVDHSHQARVNAAEYQNNARALAQADPDIANTILAIAQSAKTPESKRALASAFYGVHPEYIGRLPQWLLDHGHRGGE